MGVITTAFWVGMGAAVMVGVGRVVQWRMAVREADRAEREEMEQDRQQVYERWDTAVKTSDVDAGSGEDDGGEVVDVDVETQDSLSVDERLNAAKSEAQDLLKFTADAIDAAAAAGKTATPKSKPTKKKKEPSVDDRLRAAQSEAATLLRANAELKSARGKTGEEDEKEKKNEKE